MYSKKQKQRGAVSDAEFVVETASIDAYAKNKRIMSTHEDITKQGKIIISLALLINSEPVLDNFNVSQKGIKEP